MSKQPTVAVKYIGRRPEYHDRLYKTGLDFEQGQVREIPADKANLFLRHVDMFAKASAKEAKRASKDDASTDDTAEQLAKAQREQEEAAKEQAIIQDLRDQIATMDKAALKEFAEAKYGQNIDARATVESLRVQVIGFVDRFGAV